MVGVEGDLVAVKGGVGVLVNPVAEDGDCASLCVNGLVLCQVEVSHHEMLHFGMHFCIGLRELEQMLIANFDFGIHFGFFALCSVGGAPCVCYAVGESGM